MLIKVKIIGLGGIGSEVCEKISKFLFYKEIPCQIHLIDGDSYEYKNLERQNFKHYGFKAESKKKDIIDAYGDNSSIFSVYAHPLFITEENVGTMIQNNDFVFLGVDNHKSRRIVSNYCKKLDNICLISGGNEFTDGNVQIYVRKEGKDVTASLTDYHPEIISAGDKLPNEMSCLELQNSKPQLLFANAAAALIMCWAFYNIINDELVAGEVYFDMKSMKTDSKIRVPKN
jgi:molybdopterin/thiamine biosynthesis adenylyltransferase